MLPLSTGMLLAPPRDPRPRVTACGSWVLDAATGVTDSTEDERVRGAAVKVNPSFKQVRFDSELVKKSAPASLFVIPAKAGIQSVPVVSEKTIG